MFLHLVLVMKATCNLEEFVPTTPYDLELLKLRVSSPLTSYSDFVDGLLLTCHPKTLLVTSDFDSNQNFAKVYVLLFFFFFLLFYYLLLFLFLSPPKINPLKKKKIIHRHGWGLSSCASKNSLFTLFF